MRIAYLALAAAIVAAAPGMARPGTATKYRPANLFGGYEDKEIEPGLWKVKARSNGIAEAGFARNMATYRAAEILSARGFTHMQIVNQKGHAEMMRSGADMRHIGETMTLWVRGTNEPGAPPTCRAKYEALCFTVPVARTMERTKPLLTFPGDGS